MQKQYLECGKIVSTHGVGGEMKVQPWCDSPAYLCALKRLYLGKGQQAVAVAQARPHKNMVLLKLQGVDTVEQAQALRGKVLYLDRADAPQEDDGSYFIQDLVGLTVKDADTGQVWGTLSDVFATGANDVYAIAAPDGRQLLIPAIKQVVLGVDLQAGIMEIRPLEGLFDAD